MRIGCYREGNGWCKEKESHDNYSMLCACNKTRGVQEATSVNGIVKGKGM